MKKLIAVVIFAAITVSASIAQEKNFIDQNYISVNGYNQSRVTPNRIYINFTIDENDTKGRTSLADLEKRMFTALQRIGIDVSKQLTVRDLSSSYKKYILKRQDVRQSKEYELVVDDAKTVTDVFSALDDIGLANAGISRAEHSDILEYKLESKVQAVWNAREKAQALAQALGQDIGKAIYILDNERMYFGSTSNTVMLRSAVVYEDFVDASLPQIEFQDIILDSNVTVYFELK
ncbi:MAG: SIMPL domain-containing protein [Rikenellaceae bacterium]|nr:SIMPL domain-containing protein [Rikenellaceae bacterium]